MGLLDFNNPELIQGLMMLTAKKGQTPGLLQNFLQMQEQRKQRELQEQSVKQSQEMRAMQMQQMQRQQEAEARRQAAFGRLAEQNPQLAPLFEVAPEQAVRRAFPEPPKPKMGFAPNGMAVDLNALEPGTNYAPPEKTPDWKDPEYQAFKLRESAARRPQVTTNVMPPREVFKDSMALKKDFDAQPEVKGFKEVQSAWDQISTALADPSAANDLAAATKFMKLLDPGSVVRESELAMAMQASGALDRFMNMANRIKTGQKLTPTQRQEFRAAGEALYSASKNRFGETVQQYEGIAKQYGLDPQFIPKQKPQAEGKKITMGGKSVEAKQAPDGHYYVKSGNRWYRVEE